MHAWALLFVAWLGQEVIATSPSNPPTDRILHAATKRTDLLRRGVRISKRFESEFSYIEEENGWSGRSTFASQVRVRSQKPILSLEEIEHHLQNVQCGDGRMKLSFVDKSSAQDAYNSCRDKNGGFIITSHNSCNDEGERSVYKVHDVAFADEGKGLDVSVTQEAWNDAFDLFDISFGHTADDHLFRRHSDFTKLRTKRQTLEIPQDTPDNVNRVIFDLAREVIDTTFSAESFLFGLDKIVPIPELPIEIGCANCSTRGQVVLSQGAINIDLSQIDLIPDFLQGGDDGKDLSDVISGGFIELAAVGVGARLELFARPKVSQKFDIALFTLPVFGFVIPGIGKAGANFEPRLAVGFDLSGGFELRYGIDVAVPDNSNIRLELGNLGNSGINGFSGTTLTPLPFVVNITDVDIVLDLAFKPTIPIGFEFLTKLKAEAVVSMNLPRLDAKLSTNSADNCGPKRDPKLPAPPAKNEVAGIAGGLAKIGPLVLVGANISITADASLSFNLPLIPPPFNGFDIGAQIFSTVFPLVTSCVNPKDLFMTATATIPEKATTTPCKVTTNWPNPGTMSATPYPPNPTMSAIGGSKPPPSPSHANETMAYPTPKSSVAVATKVPDHAAMTVAVVRPSMPHPMPSAVHAAANEPIKPISASSNCTSLAVETPLAPTGRYVAGLPRTY